jgi:hypothetical protein
MMSTPDGTEASAVRAAASRRARPGPVVGRLRAHAVNRPGRGSGGPGAAVGAEQVQEKMIRRTGRHNTEGADQIRNGKNHGPFGQNLLIAHGHWGYGLSLPPPFS